MSFEVVSHAGRTVDFTVPLYEADGTTSVTLDTTDVVRVQVSRAGTEVLGLNSTNDTAHSSGITIDSRNPASCTVRFAQGDLSGLQGAYDVEVLVVDDSETAPTDAAKLAEMGVLHVIPTGDGDVDKPS